MSAYPSGGTIRVCEILCSDSAIHKLAFTNNFAITADNLESKVAEVCQSAVKLYLFQPALTTLHAVTACQALADLTQRFATTSVNRSVYAQLWRLIWIWLSSLYLEKGYPAKLATLDDAKKKAVDLVSWEEFTDLALQSQEVHTIKMVYSCKWLFENIEADGLYQLAVGRMLG